MKNKLTKTLVATAAGLTIGMMTPSAHAWYAGASSFAAYTGTFTEGVSCGGADKLYWAKVTFKFNNNAIANINDYRNGGNNPGTLCDNVNAYLSVDMTAVGDSWDDELDVIGTSFIYTNVPSPKLDVDDDNLDGENEESEVTVLGAMVAETNYYMTTYFLDYRDNDPGDSGKIQVNLDISKKGLTEYNVCQPGDGPQVSNAYGDAQCSL